MKIGDTVALGRWLQAYCHRSTGKTYVWDVLSRDGDILCHIKWYGPWRCYALSGVLPSMVFNAECLSDLSTFLKAAPKSPPSPVEELEKPT